MKTSIIEVSDMLSVLTVEEVEKRFGELPGVGSATVNYAAGNATVRYDETLLEVADIKILVHQRAQQSADVSPPKDENVDKPAHKHGVDPMAHAASASAPAPTVPKAQMAPMAAASAPAEGKETKPVPDAPPSPAAAPHHD